MNELAPLIALLQRIGPAIATPIALMVGFIALAHLADWWIAATVKKLTGREDAHRDGWIARVVVMTIGALITVAILVKNVHDFSRTPTPTPATNIRSGNDAT